MVKEYSSNGILPLDGLRVLIVEDDLDTKELFTFVFEQVGAEVINAMTASEALDILKTYEADVLISNISLPDEDGCWLIGEVKARYAQRDRKIAAVAVTAAARDSDRVRILNAGFHKHLSKPIEPDKLVQVVANLASKPSQDN